MGKIKSRLTLVEGRVKKEHSHWYSRYKCKCGNEIITTEQKVRAGISKSCGCLRSELLSKRKTKHGKSGTPEYKAWIDMKSRCLNKNHDSYPDYGGRGIFICERWLLFENFYEDMGKRPAGRSIDRIDNDGGYEPQNCRWATLEQQNSNQRRQRRSS